MSQPLEEFEEPANLSLLRRLVTVLLLTMIIGFAVLVALFVSRFSGQPTVQIPSQITLPDGTSPSAFTQGPDWWAVVTTDDQILIYNRSDNRLRQTIKISP